VGVNIRHNDQVNNCCENSALPRKDTELLEEGNKRARKLMKDTIWVLGIQTSLIFNKLE
jgi:hypothetical protein